MSDTQPAGRSTEPPNEREKEIEKAVNNLLTDTGGGQAPEERILEKLIAASLKVRNDAATANCLRIPIDLLPNGHRFESQLNNAGSPRQIIRRINDMLLQLNALRRMANRNDRQGLTAELADNDCHFRADYLNHLFEAREHYFPGARTA